MAGVLKYSCSPSPGEAEAGSSEAGLEELPWNYLQKTGSGTCYEYQNMVSNSQTVCVCLSSAGMKGKY